MSGRSSFIYDPPAEEAGFILYVDDEIVVVNKPAELLSVPGKGAHHADCVVSRVKERLECIDQPSVHRLDMATSGLMVLARNKAAHRHLSIQFLNRSVKKRYEALLEGVVEDTHGRIELAFRLDVDNRPFQIYDPVHGKIGTTLWKKMEVDQERTRIEFHPLTGRTHQLRLHASHPKGLGIPIVGDRLYGTRDGQARMCLHASDLTFLHPRDHKEISFHSGVPF